MNKIFKVIWSHTTQSWVAVSELTKAHGKTKSVKTAVASALLLTAGSASAASVVNGETITGFTAGDGKDAVVYGKDITAGSGNDRSQENNILFGSLLRTANGGGKNNVQVGYNITTGGWNTIAVGRDITTGAGSNSIVLLGENVSASERISGSLGAGKNVQVRAINATALGTDVSVSGYASLALGFNVNTGSSSAIGIGRDINVNAERAIVIGSWAKSSGDSAISIGNQATSFGHSSVAIGRESRSNTASADRSSVAIGRGAIAAHGRAMVNGHSPDTGSSATQGGTAIGSHAIAGTATFDELSMPTSENGWQVYERAGMYLNGYNATTARAEVTRRVTEAENAIKQQARAALLATNSSATETQLVEAENNALNTARRNRTINVRLDDIIQHSGQDQTAIGVGARAVGDQSIAIGGQSVAGASAIVLGANDMVTARDTKNPWDTKNYAQSIKALTGRDVRGWNGDWVPSHGVAGSTVIGSKSFSKSGFGTALGSSALVWDHALGGVAIGVGAVVGTDRNLHSDGSVAIGPAALAYDIQATAIGSAATAIAQHALAAGVRANASANSSVALGDSATSSSNSSVAIATNSTATADNAMAIGVESTASAESAIAMGTDSKASANSSVSIATNSVSSTENSIALGKDSYAGGQKLSEINADATTNLVAALNALSGGTLNHPNIEAKLDEASRAAGNDPRYAEIVAKIKQDIYKHNGAVAARNLALSLIDGASDPAATSALAIGDRAIAKAKQAIAIGLDSSATSLDAIAMGSKSAASAEAAISIGKDSVASGELSIAVGTGNRVSGNYSGAFGDPSIVEGTASYTFGNDNAVSRNTTGAFVMGNRNRMGAKPTYGAAGNDINTVEVDVTKPLTGIAALGVTGEDIRDVSGSVVIGNDNTVTSKDTFILGSSINTLNNIQTGSGTVANSVYLGKDSTAKAGAPTTTASLKNIQDNGQDGVSTTGGDKGKVDTATVANVTYQGFQGNTADGVVTVGSAGHERRIQNVAAGEISATSTDAINGSQLYLITKAIDDVSDNIPFSYTVKEGGKNVPVTPIGDQYYKDADIANLQFNPETGKFHNADGSVAQTQPKPIADKGTINVSSKVDDTDTPDTLNNIKGNLPQTVNRGDKTQDTNTVLPTTGAGVAEGTKAETGPTDIAGIYNNAATVGDVLNAGWNLQGDSNPVDFVKPYDTVNFIDSDTANITVESADGKTSTIKVDVITTTLSNSDGEVDTPQGEDEAKLVNASTVVSAINESGWIVTIGRDDDEFEDQDDKTDKLITMGKTATFRSGKNLKVKQENANITFATEDDVEFNSVNATVFNVPGANTPDKSAVSISRDGDVGKITLNGDGGATAAITVVKGAGNINAATNTQSDRLVYTDSTGTEQPIATMNDGLIFAGNNVRSMKNIHKLGSTVNIVGERDDSLTGGYSEDDSAKNNIMVDADGNNKLTVKLAKDLVNLKSVTTKDADGNKSVMNGKGITITPFHRGGDAGSSTGTGSPVSLTNTGLNNGGNFITNVGGHLPGAVSRGSNELITAPITYGKLPDDWETREFGGPMKNDAATVGDVLNAGWNLKGPQTVQDPEDTSDQVDFVRPYDSVKFNHGKNTRVLVGTNPKNTENTIKFDVDFPVAYTDEDGNPLAMDENGDFYKVGSDGNITSDQATGDIKISLINPNNQNGANHETGDPVTLTNLKDNIGEDATVLPQTAGSPFTKENFDANTDGHNAATVNDVLNAGWNAYVDDATDVNNFRALVNPADKVVFKGENGVTVSAETESDEGVTTFKFSADTAELTPIAEGEEKAGSIGDLSDEEGKKLVNASTVANAINKAGFTLKASAVENEGTRDDDSTAGENGELINSGETVEMIAGKNLSVKHNKEGKITYATKDDVEFKSVQLGENKEGPKLTATTDNTGIKVSDKDGTEPVHITNLKGNFDGANNQAAPTTEASAANKPREVTNAATVGDVLNAGWNLQENGTAKDFVRHTDTVNFANGTGTTVSITSDKEDNPTNSTVTVNLDFGEIESDETTGAVTEVTDDNKVASTQNVAEAIRNSGWKLKDENSGEKVIHPSDEVTFKNGTNTEAVVGADGSVTINVANTALASDTVKKGAVADPGNEGHKLVNATTVAKAINESGWNVDIGKETGEITDQDGKGPSTVNPSEGVTFKAGKNLIVKKSTGNDAHEITFATNKNVDFESVQLGYDGTGPKLQKGTDGSIKVSGSDGSAPVKITNVAAGAEKYTGTTTAKDGLTNLAAAPVNNALTVGDAQNMGWVVDTANAGTSQNFNKQVKNAQEVVFNGVKGVEVKGRDDAGKYVVDIGLAAAAAGSLKAETGATDTNPTGKLAVKDNADGFVTADNVAKVVNQSGWKLGGNDKDNQPIADTIINPGESVSFVDGNNTKAVLEVDPNTGNAKVKVNVETTALEKDPAKAGAVKTPDNGDKLVNATTVAKAINESGWNVDIGKETGDITDQEGKGPSTVNPSEGVTFKAGKNLIVKKSAGNDAHEITFATNKNVDFESVQLGYNGQGPKLTADNGNIKVGNKDGNSPVHITNLSGNLDPAHNVGDKTQTKGAVYNPNGVEVVGGAFTKKADYPTANLANIYNNAATVGDVLNSGWNLKANAADVDFVKAYDTVEFINGDTTTVSVTNTDGKRSEIKVEVQTTGLKVSDGTADTAVDGSNVAGDKGKVVVPTAEADKKKLVDAEHIANAINNSGFTLKTNKADGGDQEGTSQDELITPGTSVEMVAGKNLKVKQETNGKVTYSTKDDVEFTSVQFGKDGPKISKGDNGEIKVSGANGTDTVKITNVAPAAPKYENEALAPKNGLTNFAGNKVSDTDVLTVADAKTMGWIVSSDKKTSALGTAYSNNVTNAKEVKFVGEGDLVTVSGDDDGEVRKITIKVNSGKVEANTDGAATSGADGLATTANVKEAINNSGWTLKDKAGHTTLVNPSNVVTFDESDTVTPVVTAHDDTPSVKFDVKTTALEAVKATDQDPNAKPGSIKTPSEEDGKKLVNATTVAAAINASGWNVDVDHDETAFQDKEGQGKSLVKAGETAVFKSGKNLKVKKDGTNITYATKDEVEFTSVQFGANGPKLTVDGNNIKVGDKDLAKPVHITNVAGNLLGAKKDSAAPTTEALSANKPTGDALNNVATVGDVLNAGWNLKENGTARDFVRHTDTVNFVNGTGTTVAIDPTDGTNSTVTVSVDFGDISANPDTGAVTSTDKNADKVASTKDVAEAIAASGWKLKDTAGKETIVNPSDSVTFKDSNTTSAVVNVDDKNAPYVTFEVKTTELKVSDGTADTVADGSNVAGDKGKVVVPTEEADKKKLVDAEHIANAINNAGFTLKTNKADGGEKDDQSSEEELITPGKSVEMVAGKNLKVKQEANGKVTYSTKDNVEFTSVQFGENGPKISKGDNGEIKVGDKDGNAVKITNVLAAAPKHAADGDKKGLTNLTIAEDKDVLTVADAKTMGWIVSTGVNDTDNTYFNKVTNAQEVHFVGSGGITVSGKDAGEKRIITIDIAKGEIGNQDGAATSGPNTTGFTTADDVKNAINNSGWKLGGNDKDGNSIGNDKFVNPGDSLTFADGNNTKAVIDVTDPNAPTVKINVETTGLTPIAEGQPNAGKVTEPSATDGHKLVNASTVASAINNSGFNLKASAGEGDLVKDTDANKAAAETGEQINPGDEIEMVAGKNMTVKHDKEGKITYSTKDEVLY